MDPKQRMQKVISDLEEVILDVISKGEGKYIRQKDIATSLGVYDCWEKSKWLVQTILNKLEKDERIEPKIRTLANGKKRREGWRLIKADGPVIATRIPSVKC